MQCFVGLYSREKLESYEWHANAHTAGLNLNRRMVHVFDLQISGAVCLYIT